MSDLVEELRSGAKYLREEALQMAARGGIAQPLAGNSIAAKFDKAADRIEELEGAARKVVFLDMCEQEGLSSGKPGPEEWMEALENLSAILNKQEQSNDSGLKTCDA